jgi:hypothetical protein
LLQGLSPKRLDAGESVGLYCAGRAAAFGQNDGLQKI